MQTEEYAKMRALEDHYWWFVSRRRLARSLTEKYGTLEGRTLDLGCGTGAFLDELPNRQTSVGLDFSVHAVEFCRDRGLMQIVNADAQQTPFASNSFDAVISLDTIEHVADDVSAVNEVTRTLRPGGTLVLNVPAYDWLWGPHDVALMHHRRYTKKQVRALLTGSGLKIEKLSYSVFFLFPLVVLIRVIEKRRKGIPEVRLPKVPGAVNRALVILQDIETRFLMALDLPWGSSVVAVARKAE